MGVGQTSRASQFQLHHTGIKTAYYQRETVRAQKFQLHHTGIKTDRGVISRLITYHFNCTIQELKLVMMANNLSFMLYFNCTIQELKPARQVHFILVRIFQLHHTGIKTEEI